MSDEFIELLPYFDLDQIKSIFEGDLESYDLQTELCAVNDNNPTASWVLNQSQESTLFQPNYLLVQDPSCPRELSQPSTSASSEPSSINYGPVLDQSAIAGLTEAIACVNEMAGKKWRVLDVNRKYVAVELDSDFAVTSLSDNVRHVLEDSKLKSVSLEWLSVYILTYGYKMDCKAHMMLLQRLPELLQPYLPASYEFLQYVTYFEENVHEKPYALLEAIKYPEGFLPLRDISFNEKQGLVILYFTRVHKLPLKLTDIAEHAKRSIAHSLCHVTAAIFGKLSRLFIIDHFALFRKLSDALLSLGIEPSVISCYLVPLKSRRLYHLLLEYEVDKPRGMKDFLNNILTDQKAYIEEGWFESTSSGVIDEASYRTYISELRGKTTDSLVITKFDAVLKTIENGQLAFDSGLCTYLFTRVDLNNEKIINYLQEIEKSKRIYLISNFSYIACDYIKNFGKIQFEKKNENEYYIKNLFKQKNNVFYKFNLTTDLIYNLFNAYGDIFKQYVSDETQVENLIYTISSQIKSQEIILAYKVSYIE